MTHRIAGRAFARPRSLSTGSSGTQCPRDDATAPVLERVSAFHVKRAHRAVFSRFALSLHAVIRQRGTDGEVPA
ncbi:hypothetical protein [Stappia sp.]|uniref:hypothetical protein n=1 Tax=Stappia sp. TaxID=1870903 RepID=UPI003A99A176